MQGINERDVYFFFSFHIFLVIRSLVVLVMEGISETSIYFSHLLGHKQLLLCKNPGNKRKGCIRCCFFFSFRIFLAFRFFVVLVMEGISDFNIFLASSLGIETALIM